MKGVVKKLKDIGASEELITYFSRHESPQAAWNECTCPEWMIWLVGKTERFDRGSEKHLHMVSLAVEIAHKALMMVPYNERRPMQCVQLVGSWVRGENVSVEAIEQAAKTAIQASVTSNAYSYYAAAAAEYVARCALAATAETAGVAASFTAQIVYPTASRSAILEIVLKYYPSCPVLE